MPAIVTSTSVVRRDGLIDEVVVATADADGDAPGERLAVTGGEGRGDNEADALGDPLLALLPLGVPVAVDVPVLLGLMLGVRDAVTPGVLVTRAVRLVLGV